MLVALTKTTAMLGIVLLLVGGQCVASCSSTMCSQSAPPEAAQHQHDSSGHCHQHRGQSPQHQHSPGCPHQQQSFAKGLDSYAKSVSQDLAWIMLPAEVGAVALPMPSRVHEAISPPRLTPSLVSTTVLRV
jgi:hypothetical protein